MCLCEAVGCAGDAEVAIMRVGAKTVGLEILLAVMADRNALLWPPGFWRWRGARLQLLARGGFCGGFCGTLARRRFFQSGGLRRGSRFRLLFGHLPSPL